MAIEQFGLTFVDPDDILYASFWDVGSGVGGIVWVGDGASGFRDVRLATGEGPSSLRDNLHRVPDSLRAGAWWFRDGIIRSAAFIQGVPSDGGAHAITGVELYLARRDEDPWTRLPDLKAKDAQELFEELAASVKAAAKAADEYAKSVATAFSTMAR